MRRTLADAACFDRWWQAFVPDATRLARWFTPVVPSDRSDARLSHIGGLNLSRAWCWSQLVDGLPDALRSHVRSAIRLHRRASLSHAVEGHYVGTHWLASFALLAYEPNDWTVTIKSGASGSENCRAPRCASSP